MNQQQRNYYHEFNLFLACTLMAYGGRNLDTEMRRLTNMVEVTRNSLLAMQNSLRTFNAAVSQLLVSPPPNKAPKEPPTSSDNQELPPQEHLSGQTSAEPTIIVEKVDGGLPPSALPA